MRCSSRLCKWLLERGRVYQPLVGGSDLGAHEVSLRCVRGCYGVVVGDSWHPRVELSLRLGAEPAKVDILVHAAYIPNDAKQYGMAYEFACQREPVGFRNEESFKLMMIAL